MSTTPIDFSDLGGKMVQAPPAAPGETFDFSDLGGKVVQAAQGQVRNDVENTVIVPKGGESFEDTMKRAAAYGRTVTPEQISREVRTMPGKAAETLVAAPAIGAAGAAAITGAGAGAGAAVESALPRVLPGTVAGVKAIGAWAKEHPVLAYILYDQLVKHSALARFIKGAPAVAPE